MPVRNEDGEVRQPWWRPSEMWRRFWFTPQYPQYPVYPQPYPQPYPGPGQGFAATNNPQAVVTAQFLAVHSNPAFSSRIVATATGGSYVRVLGQVDQGFWGGQWTQIQTSWGAIGFVQSRFLNFLQY